MNSTNTPRQISWRAIILTALCQTIFLLTLLSIVAAAPSITNWPRVFWSQEAAGWAAAITTVAAIVVALTTSQRAEMTALRIRQDEKEVAEQSRLRKQAALAAAIADEMLETLDGLSTEIARLDNEENATNATIRKIFFELGGLDSPILSQATNHLEAFDSDFAKMIARTSARLRRQRGAMKKLVEAFSDDTKPQSETREFLRKALRRMYNKHHAVYSQACHHGGIDPQDDHKIFSLDLALSDGAKNPILGTSG